MATIASALSFDQPLSFSSAQTDLSTAALSNEITRIVGPDGATTVIGDDAAFAPFMITAGTEGVDFIGGTSSVGGAISIGGGSNTIAGGDPGAPAPLLGNWQITTGGGQTEMFLGTGVDSVVSGGADTVHASGASVLITVTSTNTQGTVIDPTGGFVTFAGGSSGGAHILAGGAGGVYQLGTGGHNIASAGSAPTTIIGGGTGDVISANSVGGGSVLYASAGNETLLGAGSGTDTFFGFSTLSGAGNVLMDVSQSQSGQVLWLGAGHDTIRAGQGADSVVASQGHLGHHNDLIIGWNPTQDRLYLDNTTAVLAKTAAGVTATLSDNTRITFAGLTDTSQVQIVIGKPGT